MGRVPCPGHKFKPQTGTCFGGLVEDGGSTESKGTEYGSSTFLCA
jgi:hypothetical protein